MKGALFLLLLFAAEFTCAQMNKVAYLSKMDSVVCITQTKPLEYYPLDTIFQLVRKAAILNIIPAIKKCGYGYRYDTRFKDKACELLLPKWLDSYSLGFGDNDFFISFDDRDTASANCIVLHYHLKDQYEPLFFQQLPGPGCEYDSLISRGKILYSFRNNNGMYVGQILLGNKVSIAYYTSDLKIEEQLRTCILSCRFD